MSETKVGDFHVSTSPTKIVVVGVGDFSLTAGERDRVVKLVNDALKFSEMTLLPPHITHDPFRVVFSKGEICVLTRLDTEERGLEFTFDQGDDLIKAISDGVDRQVEERTLSGGPAKNIRGYNPPEPPI